MTDDDDFFLQQMQGVAKLKQAKKVDLSQPHQTTEAHKVRQQAATREQISTDPNHLQHYEVQRVQPHDVLGFKCHGIQDGVYRKLRQGKYQIDARLDLHKMTIETAREKVFSFINDCMKYDLRTVLIMPGKGDRNTEDPALLKSYLIHWLPQLNDVMAYHTAQPKDGGAGAFYVLLKKSERKKEQAREKFLKGRV